MKKAATVALLVTLLVSVAGLLACVAKPTVKPAAPPEPPAGTTPVAAPSQEHQFSREWLKRSNIYVYGQPTLEFLRAVSATGVTWSVYWAGLNDHDREYVDNLHKDGFRVGSNLPTVQGHMDLVGGNRALLESASCRDIDGNTSCLSWVPESKVYFMCHNNPAWQEFLKQRIRENVDGGADAIHIDEIEGTGSHLDVAGFCDYCTAGFRAHLSGHFSETELRDRFGIENVNSFNYRTYLIAQNARSVWEDPNFELVKEYLRFQYSSRYAQISGLIEYARQYAGRDILFSANTYGMMPNQQIYILLLDFAVFEMPIGTLPEGKHFVTYLLGEALAPSKTFTGFPDIFDLAALSSDDWWLWRHWLVEAYACGGSFLLPYKAYTYGGGEFSLPADKIAPYTDFIRANAGFYEGTSRLAAVGLLYSLSSTLFNDSAWQDFIQTSRVLQESHVPFEVLYEGDSQFVGRKTSLSELGRYPLIVIPAGHEFDAAAAQSLKQYLDNGGHIIQLEAVPGAQQLQTKLRDTGVDLGVETTASGNLGIMVYRQSDSMIVHFVNYNYDYGAHDFIPEDTFQVAITVPDSVNMTGKVLKLISPDQPQQALNYNFQENKVVFTVPSVHEYSLAVFE